MCVMLYMFVYAIYNKFNIMFNICQVKLWQAIDKVNVSNLRRRKRGSHGLPKPRETIELLVSMSLYSALADI